MSFQCPQCANLKSLRIIKSIELAPDARSDEISLQVLRCQDCGYEGLGVYEESSRGALGSESVDHYGFQADKKTIHEIQSEINRCPKPKDARCNCRSHQKLNRRDQSGRWIRPGFIPGQKIYPIKL